MLSDEQIDRYSRQIILPQVGAAGQQRLLGTRAAVHGCGALAATAARYLVGAGIGGVSVDDAELAEELRRLNPDVAVSVAGHAGAALVLVADLARDALDAVAATAPPLCIGAGLTAGGGWLHVAGGGRGCLPCAARAAGPGGGEAIRAAIAASALGAVAALSGLTHVLRLDTPHPELWWRFDAAAATLTPQRLQRRAACHAPSH
ncbi:MAG: ThiF family adenylyltransferase [Deltaproteobacteria bacterium]|nr:ThiF family adenylyltransferase [Deltaproteobacteria bacterium]